MSDQMPDEVWLYHPSQVARDDVIGRKWTAYETDVGVAETRYIRAALMDETTQCYTASARGLQRQLVEQQQRADRLHALLASLEWSAHGRYGRQCPCCRGSQKGDIGYVEAGHANGCALQEAINHG